jgi:hypothetical protein
VLFPEPLSPPLLEEPVEAPLGSEMAEPLEPAEPYRLLFVWLLLVWLEAEPEMPEEED